MQVGVDENAAGLDASPNGAVYLGRHGGGLRLMTWGDDAWQEVTPPPDQTQYAFWNLSVGGSTWVAVGTESGTGQPGVEPVSPILLSGPLGE